MDWKLQTQNTYNARKTLCSEHSSVPKTGNANCVVTENQLKHCFWKKKKKKNREWGKKDKKIEIQVLTKEFTPYKIRYKFIRKRM